MDLNGLLCKSHFYQQIRLLLQKLRDGKTADATLLDENLRINSPLNLDAPGGEIERLSQTSADAPIEVTAWRNGLTGAMGALPVAYTEWLIERQYRYGDRSARAFIDIFNHRLYCLDYLAWQKNHYYAQTEGLSEPSLRVAMLALSGLLHDNASGMPYSALLTSPVRSMANLEQWLYQSCGVPAEIVPFTGGWRQVDKQTCCRLGTPSQTLATAPMIGTARRESHAHFDVVFGPMSRSASRQFTAPEGIGRALWTQIRAYVGPTLEFSIYVTLSGDDLQPQALGQCALGIDLFLGNSLDGALQKMRLLAPAT